MDVAPLLFEAQLILSLVDSQSMHVVESEILFSFIVAEEQRTMKVLIAIDDSPCSTAAMDTVSTRVWPKATQFRVLNVMEPLVMMYGYGGAFAVENVAEADRDLASYLRKFVDEKVSQLRSTFGKEAVTGDVYSGSVAQTIIDTAKEWNADLIIVGSHGRKGFKRLVLGSVAETVASQAPCSVEIARPATRTKDHLADAESKDAASIGGNR